MKRRNGVAGRPRTRRDEGRMPKGDERGPRQVKDRKKRGRRRKEQIRVRRAHGEVREI